jgi:two-component system CheB/CheR fusion protein
MRTNGTSKRDFLIDFYPYQEEDRVIAVGVVLKDVTELRHLERELRRLMDELQHRVKNTLATVSSIVSQTMNDQVGRTDLVDKLKSRIGALASTHTLLTLQDWRSASLREILDTELAPFDHVERIRIDGPAVMVPPKHALCLTLTLHELATNAAKYGALSLAGGKLSIVWNVSVGSEGQRLHLTWTESGVGGIDPSSAKPSFGSRLIRNAIVHDLQGICEYDLTPSGLCCTLSCPF